MAPGRRKSGQHPVGATLAAPGFGISSKSSGATGKGAASGAPTDASGWAATQGRQDYFRVVRLILSLRAGIVQTGCFAGVEPGGCSSLFG